MDIELAARENKLAELEILRQSLEERERRVWELEKRVEILQDMLNRASSIRVQYPQPLLSTKQTPRRWSVK